MEKHSPGLPTPCLLFSIVICIVFFFHSAVKAQFGIQAGTTISNFYYSGNDPTPNNDFDVDLRPYLGYDIEFAQAGEQKPLTSPYVSLYYAYSLTKSFGLQAAVGYSRKGVIFRRLDYEKIVYKVKINYLEIPLSLSFHYLQRDRSGGDIYVGGYGAFKLKASKELDMPDTPFSREEVKSVKAFEGGLHTGINYKHTLLGHHILIDLRIFIGLTNIFEPQEGWTPIYLENKKTKITGLNLSIGYEL